MKVKVVLEVEISPEFIMLWPHLARSKIWMPRHVVQNAYPESLQEGFTITKYGMET